MKYKPILDPNYLPMIEFERLYQIEAKAQQADSLQNCILTLVKNPQQIAQQQILISLSTQLETQTLNYLNRFIKSMLWIYGGYKLYCNVPHEMRNKLQKMFSSEGEQKFDAEFIVEGIFDRKLEIISCAPEQMPKPCSDSASIGGKSGGLRLGFDLGGSDKKIAAIANGQVLFTQSIIWDPYPQEDLNWHRKEVKELYELGASKLPGAVGAMGGSAPGIIMDNKVKVGSLFRGLNNPTQRLQSCDILKEVAKELFGDIPFCLANDGDVTALAGAMILKKNKLLGIAMGTSEAAGYTNAQGAINSWFSELAFVPVDMSADRSQDEWSKDWGTGAEYFSQQAVIRLAPRANISFSAELSKPQKLALVQEKLREGHNEAKNIYQSIGCYLGYALPWYHRFYNMENVLLLGRVLKGLGGQIIITEAEKILADEFPELKLQLFTLSDEDILHGQAMAAASLA